MDESLKSSLLTSIQENDQTCFEFLLASAELSDLTESGKKSIFHDIANLMLPDENLSKYFQLIVTNLESRYSKSNIIALLNSRCSIKQSTPLLLSIKNHKKLLALEMISQGADISLKDENGSSALHMAASAGNIALFIKLVEKGLDIEEKDQQGRQPIHLAALEGFDLLSSVIISFTKNLSEGDKEGQTPLHLATFGLNYRIIRHLLIAGANKRIVDKHGKTPLDIAITRGNLPIIKLLTPKGLRHKLNPCRVPLTPFKLPWTRPVLFASFSVFRYFLVIFFIYPRIDIPLSIISISFIFLSICLFLLLITKDPGYLNPESTFNDLYETFKPEFICPYCRVLKERDTRHCQHCNRCVQVTPSQDYDHHCPWIKNCVGKENHKIFIVFLIFVVFDFTFHATLGLLDFTHQLSRPSKKIFDFKIDNSQASLCISLLSLFGLLFVLPLLATQISNWVTNCKLAKKYQLEMKKMKETRESGENLQFDSRVLVKNSYSSQNSHVSQLWISKGFDDEKDEGDQNCCYRRKEVVNGLDVNSTLPS